MLSSSTSGSVDGPAARPVGPGRRNSRADRLAPSPSVRRGHGNVDQQRQPDVRATAQGDLVTHDHARSFGIDENRSAHQPRRASSRRRLLLYVQTGAENNRSIRRSSLLGDADDRPDRSSTSTAPVNVSAAVLHAVRRTAGGPLERDAEPLHAGELQVSPYIKGTTPNDIQYELRNNNIWTNLSGAPIATNNAYYDEWLGTHRETRMPSAGGSTTTQRLKFNNQRPLITELIARTVSTRSIPASRLSATAGTRTTDTRSPIIATRSTASGLHWSPTPRTNLVANWEHRFFGSSYLLRASTTAPRSPAVSCAFRATSRPTRSSCRAARGGDVRAVAELLLASRFPDPAERQQIVESVISRPRPADTLSGPVNLYTQQIISAGIRQALTVGMLGRATRSFSSATTLQHRADHRRREYIAAGSCRPERQHADGRDADLDP